MKALQYSFSIPNYVAVRAADRLPLGLLQSGKIPGLSEIEPEPLALPGPNYVRLKPRLCGVCGSDMSMLLNRAGPALTPFISFPLVPGHEIVAEIVETGANVTGLSAGQRVVVDPMITCEMRGLVPCPPCASGQPALCTRAAEGNLSAGMLIGFCRDLPGGWSQEMVAHRSQLFPIPDDFSDETAVLIEPFSVAVHAVLRNPPPDDANVLIIGAGQIGLFVLAALRMLGRQASVTALTRHPLQAEMAQALGATYVLRGASAGEAATQVTGARRYKPIVGRPVYAGGFDWVYDCVGSSTSIDESLRVSGPHGHLMMIGCAAEMRKLDLSFVWARELQISGSYVYAKETHVEGAPHTFEIAMKLLQAHPEIDLSRMITHRFPLSDWRQAMQVSLARGKHAALKVIFDCQAP